MGLTVEPTVYIRTVLHLIDNAAVHKKMISILKDYMIELLFLRSHVHNPLIKYCLLSAWVSINGND